MSKYTVPEIEMVKCDRCGATAPNDEFGRSTSPLFSKGGVLSFGHWSKGIRGDYCDRCSELLSSVITTFNDFEVPVTPYIDRWIPVGDKYIPPKPDDPIPPAPLVSPYMEF